MAAHIEKKNFLKIMSNSVEVGAERRMCKGKGKTTKTKPRNRKAKQSFFMGEEGVFPLLG